MGPGMRSNDSKDFSERGGILLGMILIITFLTLGPLLIDLLCAEKTARTLYETGDAGSLAGALYLEPDETADPNDYSDSSRRLDAWRRSKVVAFNTLKKNSIYGREGSATLDLRDSTASEPSQYDLDDTSEPQRPILWTRQRFEFSDMLVQMRRGMYYQQGSARLFLSLESDPYCCNIPDCRAFFSQPQYQNNLQHCGNNPSNAFPVYYIANGVQVIITLKRTPRVFGRMIGVGGVENISRTSVSAQIAY
jgi:hypothetical protein